MYAQQSISTSMSGPSQAVDDEPRPAGRHVEAYRYPMGRSGSFDVDERCIGTGVDVLTALVTTIVSGS
jgi:hypothetical protein